MDPIKTITGRCRVLDRADVDTDQIIPKQFLKRVERTGFGEFLFYDWRKEPGWDLPPNPILATGANFGCGSSREHAPWALEDYGFKAIVAPSLRGHLLHQLHQDRAAAGGAARGGSAGADGGRRGRGRPRERRRSASTAARSPFEHRRGRAHRLLNGLDDIGVTLQDEDAISAYERDARAPGPVTTQL